MVGYTDPETFLAETVEAGNKNRHDFHCMQLSLVMNMWFIFGDDWNLGIELITFAFVFAVWQWCNDVTFSIFTL